MHRDIAEIINHMVEKSPYDFFTCQVIENNTDGFWGGVHIKI